MARDYYAGPLHFPNVQAGKAYGEKYLGDVIYIKGKQETDYDDFLVCDYYDSYDGNLKINKKFSEEGWLMIGFADWDEVEFDPKLFSRMVIKSYCKKHMDEESFEEVFG